MPNWVDCDLYVSIFRDDLTEEKNEAAQAELKNFKDYADGDESILSANNFVPYPFPRSHTGERDWRAKNWGTEWEFSSSRIRWDFEASRAYQFRTAWTPPLPVIQKMSELYPLLRFTLVYFECGIGVHGKYVCVSGIATKDLQSVYYGCRGG